MAVGHSLKYRAGGATNMCTAQASFPILPSISVCIQEWVKYCGWGAAFVKRRDVGRLSATWLIILHFAAAAVQTCPSAALPELQADALQKRSTKPPPPLHSLQITSELGVLAAKIPEIKSSMLQETRWSESQ